MVSAGCRAQLGQRPCPEQLPPSLPAALPGRSLPGARPRAPARPCGGVVWGERPVPCPRERGSRGSSISASLSSALLFPSCFPRLSLRHLPSPPSLPPPPPRPKFLHRWVQLNVSFPFSRAFIFLNIFFVPASRVGCSLYFRRPCKCDCRRSKRGKGRKILLAAPRFSLCPCEGSPGGMSLRSRLIKKVNPCIQVAAPTCLLLGRAVCAA